MKEKPVFPLLLSMALPMVISMLVNSLYNIVDTFFVARIGEEAVTALSLVYPVQNLINAVAIGYGIGVNALIAQSLGARHQQEANRAATQGLVCSISHGVLLTILGIAIIPFFLSLFTQQVVVLQLGVAYARVAFLFGVPLMLHLYFEKVFQAVGRMKESMLCMMGGCVVNILLDPVLIFGLGCFPAMGIRGAALATGIGQLSGWLLYMILMTRQPLNVKICREYLRPDKRMMLRLYGIGIPASLNLALPSVLIASLNAILAAYGQSYVLVLGIYYKLQTFLYMPANGVIQGMRPIIGYNYGSREKERVREIFRDTLLCIALIMVLGMILCLLWPQQIMGIFTTNATTILRGKEALQIISLGFLLSALPVTMCGALEGMGKGLHSLVLSLCRYLCVILPLALILSQFFGGEGVWWAFAATEWIAAGVALALYRRCFR